MLKMPLHKSCTRVIWAFYFKINLIVDFPYNKMPLTKGAFMQINSIIHVSVDRNSFTSGKDLINRMFPPGTFFSNVEVSNPEISTGVEVNFNFI